ncbi:hypothetical protein [Pelagimonas varians]|uniref:Uncharacterized protein n=1 Tax=Pelagimonas varians TaxID=696760 RepID=A0A238K4Q9_9RHOB|nr:hypothetical protein [Pelagimonas varians]PYG30362.1 hypothetical protein C8N36_10670 [Pelagimonas varians]SMX37849.1 hypothetical protein PEV8663_01220 [Pelagimonas varians]
MKLAALINAASMEIGIKPSEAKTRARFMREHGFLRSGGRGKGAAEMQPDDLAAVLLGFNSFSEPTGTGYALRDLSRAKFDFCDWTDLTALQNGLGRPEDEKAMPYKWYGAPLPTNYCDMLKSNDLIKVLATALLFSKNQEPNNRLTGITSKSSQDALSWEIQMNVKTSQAEMQKRYIEASGDSSDRLRFTDCEEEHDWLVTANFLLLEEQQDKREVSMKIEGNMIAPLVAACADQWEDIP